jgi:hypothetical protein
MKAKITKAWAMFLDDQILEGCISLESAADALELFYETTIGASDEMTSEAAVSLGYTVRPITITEGH